MTEREVMHLLVPVAFGALILWRMHTRVRRMIGRQRLSGWRPRFNALFFPLLVALLAWQARSQQLLGMSLAGGAAVGVALGVLGLRLTRFEVTSEGRFYTPSAHLGVALSALLAARIAWRFMSGGLMIPDEGAPPPPPTLTPLTLLLVGTLAGYYWTYAVGLLRWSFGKTGVAQTQSAP
jgi:hypothetical protein